MSTVPRLTVPASADADEVYAEALVKGLPKLTQRR